MKIILFCGDPGSLKTTLASFLAGRLGALLVPTSALLVPVVDPSESRTAWRTRRYQQIPDLLAGLDRFTRCVVLDGGFPLREFRALVYQHESESITVIHTRSSDRDALRQRLTRRSLDHTNVEAESALDIVNNSLAINHPVRFDELREELAQGLMASVIDVDVDSAKIRLFGSESPLSQTLMSSISRRLSAGERIAQREL